MISPDDILDMNIARYRGLMEIETNPELRTKLKEALARDLVTKRERAQSRPADYIVTG